MANTVYEFSLRRINGEETSLSKYAGKVLLMVNLASECGLTPQYEGLEKVYEHYRSQGFEVLGFPANEFGAQEPGSNEEIKEFCQTKFGVKFPMFEKIVVKGEAQHPLYKHLTDYRPKAQVKDSGAFEEKLKKHGIQRENPADILWNFEKFLVNKKGQVVERFSPDITPEDPIITAAIEKELAVP